MSMTVARWLAVGALGLVVQLAVLALLVRAGLGAAVATALAVSVTIVHNFAWHERWTWRHRPARDVRQRVARFGRFGLLTAVASLVGAVVLTTWLADGLHVPLLVANVIAVLLVSVVNFLSAHFLVFTPTARPAARVATMGALVCAASMVPGAAGAAELTADTKAAWARYVRAVEDRTRAEIESSGPFLWQVGLGGLRRGEIAVLETRLDALEPDVPGGLIHHWRGAIFVPGVTLDQVLTELQSADGRRHLQDDVLEWRMLSGPPESARIFLKLVRREIVTATYNTVHDVRYRRHAPLRASSRSEAIRIAELAEANTPAEREKPVGDDRGFLWRLNSYWRYEQVPGGVIIQVESITLSRQVPLLVRPIVGPIVDRIARESMIRTLTAVRRRFTAVSSTRASAG